MAEAAVPGNTRPWLLVVADLVGTTVRDDGAVLEAVRCAVAAVSPGRTVDGEDLGPLRGAAKSDLFRALVAERADAALDEFRSAFRALVANGRIEPIAGAEATLRELRARGIATALTTGLDADVVDPILRHLGWRKLTDVVLTAAEAGRGRPAPDLVLQAAARCGVEEMGRVVVCGDTTNDLRAGANAGAGMLVGVLTGAHDRDRLRRAPHHYILDSIADLPDLLSATD